MVCRGHSLLDLIDLALQPEGIVNFNILRTFLHAVVSETNLTNVRSECHAEECFCVEKELNQEISEDDVQQSKETPELKFTEEEMNPTPEVKDTQNKETELEDSPIAIEEISDSEYTKEIDVKMETEDLPVSALKKSEIPGEKKMEKHISQLEDTSTAIEDISESEYTEESDVKMKTEDLPASTLKKSEIPEEKSLEKRISQLEDTPTPIEEISESEYTDAVSIKREPEDLPASTLKKSTIPREKTLEKHISQLEDTLSPIEEISESEYTDAVSVKREPEDLPASTLKKSTIPREKTLEKHISQPPKIVTQIQHDTMHKKDISLEQREKTHAAENALEDRKPRPRKVAARKLIELSSEEDMTPEQIQNTRIARDAWDYTRLSKKVEGVEEGVDELALALERLRKEFEKMKMMKPSAARKQVEVKEIREGGLTVEDLEALDERLSDLEEAMARFAADHELLMRLNDRLMELLEEFESIKALASLIEKMRIDISMKADKEETWAALDTKADLELVNSKVDRWEFELAIEELGEAIGLLGLKFTRKNDEWEERAAEIWKAIDGKMTFDVFEKARIKIEKRMTALMYGLRTLKKVVEELLYPEAGGVTRCILCRRPACISGLECMEGMKKIGDSPESVLTAKSAGGDSQDPKKFRKILDDAIAKQQKLEVPPYCEPRDTIIRIPYRSASYRSYVEDKEFDYATQMKERPARPARPRTSEVNTQSKLPEPDLYFTNVMLAKMEREKSASEDEGDILISSDEAESSSTTPSSKSPVSVDLTSDPRNAMDDFAPARAMPDIMRREVLKSPTSPKNDKSGVTLTHLQLEK